MTVIIIKLLVAAASFFGAAYGIYRILKKNMPFYFSMVIFGVMCAAMGRIFEALNRALTGDYTSGFQIGVLGIIGSILFFFTSNQGLMDRLGDDGSDKMKKCRSLGFLAPAVFLVMWFFILFSGCGIKQVVVSSMVSLAALPAGYFHLKHIFLPDVEEGIIKNLRAYNLVALIYEALCIAERLCYAYNASEVVFVLVYIAIGIVLALLVPVLEKGVLRWTM